jgi:spore maturation protein A
MNYLWGGMILVGVLYGAFSGQMQAVSDEAISSAKEAVTLCITMVGVLSLWMGMMEIGKEAGLIEGLSKRIRPVIRFLFPGIPKDHPACQEISTNFIANILGLGWAATPAGLQAMKSLADLEEERRRKHLPAAPKGTASKEMCTFLILNISSLQLIPINIIAYRSQYGSTDPTAILGPALVATLVSTVVAVIFCKWMEKSENYKNKHTI